MAGAATQIERNVMSNLSDLARKAMRSKPTLRILSRLQDKGWIEFNPFEGTATVTDKGKQALERQ